MGDHVVQPPPSTIAFRSFILLPFRSIIPLRLPLLTWGLAVTPSRPSRAIPVRKQPTKRNHDLNAHLNSLVVLGLHGVSPYHLHISLASCRRMRTLAPVLLAGSDGAVVALD